MAVESVELGSDTRLFEAIDPRFDPRCSKLSIPDLIPDAEDMLLPYGCRKCGTWL
jgi:hypothetical protein